MFPEEVALRVAKSVRPDVNAPRASAPSSVVVRVLDPAVVIVKAPVRVLPASVVVWLPAVVAVAFSVWFHVDYGGGAQTGGRGRNAVTTTLFM